MGWKASLARAGPELGVEMGRIVTLNEKNQSM